MKYNIQTITYLFETFIGLNEVVRSHVKCARQFKQQAQNLVKINQLSSDDVEFVLNFLQINTYDISYTLPKTKEYVEQFKRVVFKLYDYHTSEEKADALNQLKQQKAISPHVFKFVVKFYELEGVSLTSKATLYDEVISELRSKSAYFKVLMDNLANGRYLYCYWSCLTDPRADEEKFAIMLLKQGKYFEVITRHTEERSCGGPIITESDIPNLAKKIQAVGIEYFIEGKRPKDRTQVITTEVKKRTPKSKSTRTSSDDSIAYRPRIVRHTTYDYRGCGTGSSSSSSDYSSHLNRSCY